MKVIVGIDLGTTFSAIATLDETGRPQIVYDRDGSNIMPSVVSFTSNRSVEVGEGARRILETDPKTFGRFKRNMGTEAVYEVEGHAYTPTDLSAFILRRLKDDAERMLGPIDEAVVTTPANFSNEAREATMDAAQKAGLKIQFIINEPTAAALYYAFKTNGGLAGTYAVYDLGGGTFDISIIRVAGQDVEVLASEGIAKLGGVDFDGALQSVIRAKYKAETGADLQNEDFTRNKAEEEKKSLSRRNRTLVRVNGSGGRRNLEVTRSEFEESISAMIAQTELLCESVLESVREKLGVELPDIEDVFLVGGSTRIPCVQASVERVFGRAPVATANVDEVVALGAALYAAYKSDRSGLSAIQRQAVGKIAVKEITGKYFGTLALIEDPSRGERRVCNSIIIPKGQRLPCEVTEKFHTVRDGQTAVDCSVTESNAEEKDPKFVKMIWEGSLEVPPGRPAGQEIAVTYRYDENQIMSCVFTDVGTGKKTEIDLRMTSGNAQDDSEIEKFTVD